jgi:N-acetylmuramoyl-L-alanine amidase
MLLKLGSTGRNVRELQTLLKERGFWTHPHITETFGPVTETAVINFQKANGLKPDGKVGPATWTKLAEPVAVKVTPVYTPVDTKEDFSDPEDEMLIERITEAYPTSKNIAELVKFINAFKLTRKINRIVYHCTATQPDATIAGILKYWRDKLKWKSPGYHILVTADGQWSMLQDFNLPSNGVEGINRDSIHISYIGGIDRAGKAKDTRTAGQNAVFEACYHLFSKKVPAATHHGHYEFSNKACPSYNVKAWITEIKNGLL